MGQTNNLSSFRSGLSKPLFSPAGPFVKHVLAPQNDLSRTKQDLINLQKLIKISNCVLLWQVY